MARITDIPPNVSELAADLARHHPMRRGSLSERYVKCSKPGCGCASSAENRHGPYYSLTRGIDGQTKSRFLTAEQAAVVREQIQEGQVFRKLLEEYWMACEGWADACIETPKGAVDAEKKPSSPRRSTRRRSPLKSKTFGLTNMRP